ncbi:MAG: hypothetical protein IJ156_01795 [Bacteroidales bacterium]|nr:hypothetical protein [Bacteroidales bacterium]
MRTWYFLAGIALLILSACSKADSDAFGGNEDRTGNPVQTYMLALTDDLAASALEELETALRADPNALSSQAFYLMQGNLSQTGSTWVLQRECRLKGLVINKLDGEVWKLDYDGDLSLQDDSYPTRFTIRAVRMDPQSSHADWTITLEGSRTEREGYACTFESNGSIRYEALSEDRLWYAYGVLQMNVTRNGTLVDQAFLSLNGPRNASGFVHKL